MTEPAKTPGQRVYEAYWQGYGKAVPWEGAAHATRANWERIAGVAIFEKDQRIAELEAANEKLKADYQQVFADKCAVLRQAYPEHYRH